jgi:proteasome accessory factor B
MSYQAKIKRYLQILQMLEKSKYPSSAAMIDRISDTGVRVSIRQLKRDIDSLRNEFAVDIRFSSGKKGYYIDTEEQTFPYFLKLLEFAQNVDMLTGYLAEGSNISEIIEFEDYNSFKGLQFIRNITFSIKDCMEIALTYKRFDAETEKEYCLQPYLLREYLNRWYVIGYLSGTNEIRTFGLDRIITMNQTGKFFKQDKKRSLLELFRNIIGISASEQDKVEEIELVCKPFQGNLLKTLPLHSSQKLISETTDKMIFKYNMVVNFELTQRLLMISTQAKVIKPISLKNEIERMLAEANNFYKN